MITTYRLNTSELNEKLVELIRKSFPDKNIEITIMEQSADEYLRSSPANANRLNEAIHRIEKGDDLISVDPTKL